MNVRMLAALGCVLSIIGLILPAVLPAQSPDPTEEYTIGMYCDTTDPKACPERFDTIQCVHDCLNSGGEQYYSCKPAVFWVCIIRNQGCIGQCEFNPSEACYYTEPLMCR